MKKLIDFQILSKTDIDVILKKVQKDIDYIVSGERDKDRFKEELRLSLGTWGLAFKKQLKEIGIQYKNTNFASWELGNHLFTIEVPYSLPHFNFKSIDDFCVFVTDLQKFPFSKVGDFHSIEEVLKFIETEFNYKPAK